MLKTLLSASAALLLAAPAMAVTFTSTAFDTPANPFVIDGFEAPVAGIAYSGSYSLNSSSISGIAAAPAGDTTTFFSTPSNTSSVLPGSAVIDLSGYVSTHGAFKTLSFYWGSIDQYNSLTLGGTGLTGQTVFSGTDINNPANGNQTAGATNRLVTFYFTPGEKVTGLALSSGSRAFEIDNISGTVPEPATWVLLMAGFGLVGAAVRTRSRAVAA